MRLVPNGKSQSVCLSLTVWVILETFKPYITLVTSESHETRCFIVTAFRFVLEYAIWKGYES
jgi:hypothetical protein